MPAIPVTRAVNELAITFDVDWAPDFMVEPVVRMLEESGVRSTWFVTHESALLARMRRRPDLFELGIHPNFLPGSSHGASLEEVLGSCLRLVPEATAMRTHALYQSTPLLAEVLAHTPITLDASLFLPRAPYLRPVVHEWGGRGLLRVPYFWEDDFEVERRRPEWDLDAIAGGMPGLKVFDFHPVHLYLNSRSMDAYRELKRRAPDLARVTEAQARPLVVPGAGPAMLFRELLSRLAASGGSPRLRDLVETRWPRLEEVRA